MPSFRIHAVALLAASTLTPGCLYYGDQNRDVDRTPIVDTGVGATIIMPGQSAPGFPGGPATPGGAGSGAGESRSGGSGSAQGSGAPAGGGRISMIGGTRIDETSHVRTHEEPVWLKYLTLPFALAAAPFVAAKQAIQGEPEPGPEVPRVDPPRPRAAAKPSGASYDERRIDGLEQELDQRQASAALPGAAPMQPSATRAPSIADELASLQRAPAESGARPAPPVAVDTRTAQASSEPAADGIVDRNEDGRIDLWIYREKSEIVRRVLDEDYDGAADSWIEYQDGAPVRRRADIDHDGTVDSWTFYRDGQTSRHEQDTTGDGFRDRIGFYEAGKLVREEQDTLGSGRPDVIVHYGDRDQIIRREEDTDRDGRIDVISHYENGRLSRRELLEGTAQAPRPDAPHATP